MTGKNHTFNRYEHCFLELSRPQTKTEGIINYLLENQIDILALNETFLKPKFKFHLSGYDIYKTDRLVGTKGGVAILVKKGLIVNQEWKNEHFNVITGNEALAIEIELQTGIRSFWLPFIAQMEILVQGYLGRLMHFRINLSFSGTLTPNTSNLDVSSQTNLVKRLLT